MALRYRSAMPMYCPVLASRIVPVSGSTIPLVLGSMSCPCASVMSPVVGSTVCVDVADGEDDEEEDDDDDEDDDDEDDDGDLVVEDSFCSVRGLWLRILVHTASAAEDHTTLFGSLGAASTGVVIMKRREVSRFLRLIAREARTVVLASPLLMFSDPRAAFASW